MSFEIGNEIFESEDVQDAVGDDGTQETVWEKEEEGLLLKFANDHSTLEKNDARGRQAREKLFNNIADSLGRKFSVEEIQTKLLDLRGKWRSEDVDTMINFFQDHPLLWNTSIIQYRDKTAKNKALEDLSRQLDFRQSQKNITQKFESLKTVFWDKVKKGHTGDGGNSGKPWPYFRSLLFLKTVDHQRPSFTTAMDKSDTQQQAPNDPEDLFEAATPTASSSSTPSAASSSSMRVTGRKHRRSNFANFSDADDELKAKIFKTLDTKQDAADAFGVNVAETLRKFTETNQEFVKAQIQQVLAVCMKKQEEFEDIPMFKAVV